MNENEIWVFVDGYDRYMVSNMGRVKGLDMRIRNGKGYRIKKEKILKMVVNKFGYNQISMAKTPGLDLKHTGFIV